MLIGAHVSSSGGLLPALERGEAIGADVIQIFTTSPRAWKPAAFPPELLAQYRQAQLDNVTVQATFCHASYLINLATTDPDKLARSRTSLLHSLQVATAIGSAGLVLHLGSHLGAGYSTAVKPIAAELLRAIQTVEDLGGLSSAPILMENAAGAGGTCGRDFGELAAVLDAAGGHGRIGTCLDTQHLFASGADYSTMEAADRVVRTVAVTVGLDRLACIHLNDSKTEQGSNRDRHANLGEGLIGRTSLALLLGHPRLQNVPAVLETPGADGHGPRASDVVIAREIHADGLRRWRQGAGKQGARKQGAVGGVAALGPTGGTVAAGATPPPPREPPRAPGAQTSSRQGRSRAGLP